MPLQDLQPDDPAALGPYRLRGRLGSGGMGVVYLGFDYDGTPTAVKTLNRASNAEARARMRHEADLLSKVSGGRVAAFKAADCDAERPWLALSYIAGPTLSEVKLPLPERQFIELADGLAEGLSVLHEAGIVHRDVKPSNVILTNAGPVLVDLGIARTHEMTAITGTGVVIGSPAWMAPEQLQGHDVSPATDIWAWGATVAYAVTGRAPFGNGPIQALAWRILHGVPDLEGVPQPLVTQVSAALRKNPEERPSARELLQAATTRTVASPASSDHSPAETLAYTRVSPTARGQSKRYNRAPPMILSIGAIVVAVTILVIALVRIVNQNTPQEVGRASASTMTPSTTSTQRPDPTTVRSREPKSTTAEVTPDQIAADLQLSTSALGDNFKSLVFDLQDLSEGTASEPEQDAPILGSWWALADWCATNRRGAVGACYDQAATYYRHWFHQDPREINTETWQGAGAIGSMVVEGYDLTEAALGLVPSSHDIPQLMAGRPGVDVLCAPSCTARIDGQ